ncbi:MAG: lysophospholipid acyltransferase family protein [Aestuariivirga sp.]
MIRTAIAAFKLIAFLCFTPPMMLLQWLIVKFKLGNPSWVPRFYNQTLCRIIGIKITTEGNLPKNGLIVSNHTSWKDILILNALTPLSLIAKREVGAWLLFGSLARLQGTVFVNRESKRSIIASLGEIQTRLLQDDVLVLFPEATTYTGKSIKQFKSSYVAAAERTATDVVPVTIIYQSQHGLPLTLRQRPLVAWYGGGDLAPHLWGILKGGPISVKVIFHPPLRPTDFRNRKVLTKAAENLIRTSLAQNLHAELKMG